MTVVFSLALLLTSQVFAQGTSIFEYPEVKKSLALPYKLTYGGELMDQIQVRVIKNFKFPESLEKDAKEEGWTFDKKNLQHSDDRHYQIHPFSEGKVYTWCTPTKGSACYAYVCAEKQTDCLVVGRYTSHLANFNWSGASIQALKPRATFNFKEANTVATVPFHMTNEGDVFLNYPTSVVKNYKSPVIKKMKNKTSDKLTELSQATSIRFDGGTVFTECTSTIGSSCSSHICPTKKNDCLKVGPYNMVEFDWSKLKLTKI